MGEPARIQWDQYAGGIANITLSDPYVMAIDSRRALRRC